MRRYCLRTVRIWFHPSAGHHRPVQICALTVTLVTTFFLSIVPNLASAQSYKSVSGIVAKVQPTTGNFAWVYLQGGTINCADVGGPSGNTNILMKSLAPVTYNQAALDQMYSTTLTALVTGQAVEFRITGDSTGQFCIVERVTIGS